MKKSMILAGAALLALAACNKSEVITTEGPANEIGFNVVSNAATKADPELTGITLGTDNTYVIYASASSVTNPKYFTDQLFSYITADSKWEASSAVGTHSAIYWPFGGESVDFLAYALKPAAKSNVGTITFNTTTSAQDLTFTSWDTYANQYDVLFAVKNSQKSTTNGGTVVMEFNHAQALLSFTAQANTADLITINSITVKGLETVGTFVVDNSKTKLEAAWTNSAGSDKIIPGISTFAVPNSAAKLGDNLLIPEQSTKTFVINYTVSGNTQDYEVNIPRTIWKMGYKYTYALNFSVSEITIEENVVDWQTGTPVTLPTIQ